MKFKHGGEVQFISYIFVFILYFSFFHFSSFAFDVFNNLKFKKICNYAVAFGLMIWIITSQL